MDSKENIRLIDFGFAHEFKDGKTLKSACGTPNYAAPEIINGLKYSGPEVDIWSCGVILYSMVCGLLPFDDDDYVKCAKLFKKIKECVYRMPDHLS